MVYGQCSQGGDLAANSSISSQFRHSVCAQLQQMVLLHPVCRIRHREYQSLCQILLPPVSLSGTGNTVVFSLACIFTVEYYTKQTAYHFYQL